MIVVCDNCKAKYRLNTAMLGDTGCRVRCTACFYAWFQKPSAETVKPAPSADAPDTDDLLSQIDSRPADERPAQDLSFIDMLAKEGESIPDAVRPLPQEFKIPVVDYRPMGMGASQFGIFTFLLLAFMTTLLLLLLRVPLVHQFPALNAIYALAGYDIKAPGEGLRLSEMIAENRIEKEKTTLAIAAKLANISEKPIEMPRMVIRAKSTYGAVLETFMPARNSGMLAAGSVMPLDMQFETKFDDIKTVEIRVIKE